MILFSSSCNRLSGAERTVQIHQVLPHRRPFAFSKTTTTEHLHDLADKQ